MTKQWIINVFSQIYLMLTGFLFSREFCKSQSSRIKRMLNKNPFLFQTRNPNVKVRLLEWKKYFYVKKSNLINSILTHLMPRISFDTPCKHQKPLVFQCFQLVLKEISNVCVCIRGVINIVFRKNLRVN